MRAWRAPTGAVHLSKNSIPDSKFMSLKCGNCLGCRTENAKAWALRCTLEFNQATSTAFVTLTYDDKRLPPTLSKRHLQLFLKKLRKRMGPNRPIRFFACGEYGETTNRPHYHLIIFGCSERDRQAIDETWAQGHTKTVDATPATIAYVAGYTAKKLDAWTHTKNQVLVDQDTGEEYLYQKPFLQMSRRPGIGGDARKHTESWRDYAISNGTKVPVPRYLHDAWKCTATKEQIEQLEYQREKNRSNRKPKTLATLQAETKILLAKHALKADKRKL